MSLYQTIVLVPVPVWASEGLGAALAMLSPEPGLGHEVGPLKKSLHLLPTTWGSDGIGGIAEGSYIVTVSCGELEKMVFRESGVGLENIPVLAPTPNARPDYASSWGLETRAEGRCYACVKE